MKRFLIISFLIFLPIKGFILLGQETIPIYDTSFIQSYRDYLVLTMVAVYNSNNISFTDNKQDDISFTTNLPFYFGLAADYKWLTFEFTKNINTSPNNNKGETDSRSIGIGITGRKFWFRSFWKDYQGYFMENPEYDNPEFNEEIDPFPLRPDLHTKILFANLNYGFNYKRFSNTASLWQLEKQKKRAGSFTVGLSAGYTEMQADSALVLSKWETNFNPNSLITNYQFTWIGLNGGYLYTFPMFKRKHYFISLAFIPGLSYQFGKANIENNPLPLKKNSLGVQTETRFVFGYNHEKWYASFSASLYAISNSFVQDNSIAHGYNFLRFVYGRKIKVRESKSDFHRKIGL